MNGIGSRDNVPGGVKGQRPSPSLPFFLLALLALTAIRLWIAAQTPLSPDEAYYWVWSRALAPGYLDHPPMVALFVRLGTILAGPSVLGVRLLAPVSALIGSLLLASAAEDLFPGRRAGAWAAILLNATLLMAAGAVTMTPDTPLLLFWTATLWALARFVVTDKGGWWLLAGLFAGLALDSKYTGLLLFVGAGLWLIAVPALRAWLWRWPVWAGTGLGFLLFAPVLAWNAGHGFASFAKQGGRSAVWHPGLRFLGELLAGQIGLATPLVFALAVAGVVAAARRFWRERAPGDGLLLAVGALPALVFLEHAIGDRVQTNWPAICYPAALVAAGGVADAWRRWMAPAAALGFAIAGLVYWQAVAAPFALPARLDPTLARLGGWREWADQIEAARQASGAAFVADENYGEAAMLAWLLPHTVVVVGVAPRWALFSLPRADQALAAAPGLLVESARRAERPSSTGLGEVIRQRRGVTAERYRLYGLRLGDGAPPSVLLPRPGERF